MDIAAGLPGHSDCVEVGWIVSKEDDWTSFTTHPTPIGCRVRSSQALLVPLSMIHLEGVPPLVLLDDNLQEIDQQAIEDQGCDGLDDEEYKILIRAASAIDRKTQAFRLLSIDSEIIELFS